MNMGVKRSLQVIGIVLAVLWLPITAHCSLETLPGFEFLLCETGPVENDCCEDACAQIETPSYKVSETDTVVPVPLFEFAFNPVLIAVVPPTAVRPSTAAPPEIP